MDFKGWTLDSIRDEDASFSWMEILRFDWSPITNHAMYQILNGKTIVLIVDNERKWFEQYILSTINKRNSERPIIPIVSIDSLYGSYDSINGAHGIDIVEDMLNISYGEEYFFWYIGRGDDKRCDIAKRSDGSYLWIMGETYQNSLPLLTYDKDLDIKLIQLYRLFDKTLMASLFGEVDVEE
ncbi:MAG: HobA family DNA replication regulator [Campylobacterota bacterium]|nr:HobA family DNA replication regulator [Campylobacterota bacterium]